ncbi:MAG: hypothetical protein QJR09_05260 [Micrococcus sp.]|nr:hypothetical protein [Micrococcus sp.]
MAELIEFPDAEDLFRLGINGAAPELLGPAVRAFVKMPPKLPERFVLVTRTGGAPRDLVTDVPMLSFDCYARTSGQPDESVAVKMAGRLRAWVHALERAGELQGVPVYEVTGAGGPYRNPDPRAPQFARFTFTSTAALRGHTTS